MLKWGGIVFAIGMVLIIVEIILARRKKEGYQPADQRRIVGIFWLTVFLSGLVMALIWMS